MDKINQKYLSAYIRASMKAADSSSYLFGKIIWKWEIIFSDPTNFLNFLNIFLKN